MKLKAISAINYNKNLNTNPNISQDADTSPHQNIAFGLNMEITGKLAQLCGRGRRTNYDKITDDFIKRLGILKDETAIKYPRSKKIYLDINDNGHPLVALSPDTKVYPHEETLWHAHKGISADNFFNFADTEIDLYRLAPDNYLPPSY